MKVCIVHTIERLDRGYQLMVRCGGGYNHIYDCNLRTLEECKAIAEAQGWTVEAVGDFWQCLN